jgi:hypothetical protein
MELTTATLGEGRGGPTGGGRPTCDRFILMDEEHRTTNDRRDMAMRFAVASR